MNEQALCEFVEKHNTEVEEDWKPMSYDDNITRIDLLDDLMATHDAEAPQWVEASAVASDGTRYWARVDQRDYVKTSMAGNNAYEDAFYRARRIALKRS